MSSVGQAVGGLVGGIAGFFVGGPQGALYGAQIGMGVGGYIDPPKGPTINGPRLNDLSVQTSTYGAALPRIYGTVATHGNVFWLENNRLKEVVKKEKQGGKGGGGGSTVKTYSYYATFAVGLADVSKTGPIQGVRRIWVGGTLIYDAGYDDLEAIIASNQAAHGFRIYFGDEDQMPDPRMQADLGVDNCPAYRGLAYIVFYDFALKDYGNSLMAAQVKVEVLAEANVSGARRILNATISTKSSSSSPWIRQPGYSGKESPEMFVSSSGGVFGLADGGRQLVFSPSSQTYKSYNRGIAPYGSYNLVGNNQTLYHFDATNIGPGLWYQYCGSSSPYWWILVLNGDVIMDSAKYWTAGIYCQGVSTVGDQVFLFLKNSYGRSYIKKFPGGAEVDHNLSIFNAVPFPPSGVTAYRYSIQYINALSDRGQIAISGNRAYVYEHYTVAGYLREYEYDGGGGFTLLHTVSHQSGSNAATNHAEGGIFYQVARAKVFGFAFSAKNVSKPAMLDEVILSEVQQAGILSSADVDVSDIEQEVRGYRVAKTGAIRGALEPLQGAWPFDVIQSGYQIKFVRRGKTSVATIDAKELDARPYDTAPGVQITISHEMDTQLPRKVAIRYLDVNREYDTSEQNAERLNTDAVNIREMELPIVLTATEAAGMSEVLLYLYWLERRDVSFSLPPEYRYIEPTDVITITGEWGQYELRITRLNLESDGRLACSAKFNSAAIYTPTAKGAEGDAPEQTVQLDGPSIYIMLDVPLLADAYNSPGWPAAMAGYTSGWPGGIIYRSTDGGATWSDLQGFTSPVTLGYARDSIGAGRFDIVDASSVLQVDMLAGDLSSISESAQFSGSNLLAYGATGRWEICSPRTVELQADGSLKLSDWLRGRFGTEWAAELHQAGDAIVLMTDPDLAWIPADTASIGLARDYRGVTSGRSIDSDETRSETYEAVNLTPLSPVYLNGSRHPTTRDWTLTWTRRTRVSPEWRNSVDVPLGEASEAYEVEIYASSSYTTVKRTIGVTAASASYTSAQQVSDFGANQGTLYLRIYQLSATVGRGYPLQSSITR